MTCIAGVVSSGKVWIGGDSAGVNSNGDLQLRKDSKVFLQCGNRIIIGVSGSWQVNQTLKYGTLPELVLGMDIHDGLVSVVLPWMRENIPAESLDTSEMLVGIQGHLYHVYGARQVSEEIADYEACGCGAQVARGSLFTSSLSARMDMNPKWRIENALQAAERFCSGVRGPFNILEI